MEHKKSDGYLQKSRGFNMVKYSLFAYKPGSSFLHKCPAWCKILFIPLLNILFLCLPPYFSLGLMIFQVLLAFGLGFSIREQLSDLRPIIYYAVLLFVFQLISWFIGGLSPMEGGMNLNLRGLSPQTFAQSFSWAAEKETVFLLIKLFAIMQSASLVFKTSSSLELREGIGKLFGYNSVFTNAISMFLNFIPMLSKIWEESKRAWIARSGKANLKMYMVLLPVLFSVGMKKAFNMARAISIRK